MSNNGPFFLIKNFGCTQHSSSKLGSVFAGTKFLLFLHFVSARNAWTAVLLFSIHHTIFYMFKRHVLTQISQIYADKRQAGKWNYNYNNGRSRVSRGNKMQKLRKFYHMFYLKKSQKTHLKMYGKNYRKVAYYAHGLSVTFMLAFLGTFRCVSWSFQTLHEQ